MSTKRAYRDLHEHLDELKARGLLVTVDRQIDKDSELHALVRWQFVGGLKEEERKAFLFTNIVDGKGRKYDMPVVVGALAANRAVYSVGMDAPVEKIQDKWDNAIAHPIPPVVVENAACQEVVHTGNDLLGEGKGLGILPIPISTPGFDSAPTLTAANVVTKDPENGAANMGTYRCALKSSNRLVVRMATRVGGAGGYRHYVAHQKRGDKEMPCAIVLGAPPMVMFMGPQKLPLDADEVPVAGGLAGGPIAMVKCKTVDLMVPAESEIVIEGMIDTEYVEPEAPFGESHGHVNLQEYNAYMDVTCITRRKKAVLTSIISQVTPSESSLIKKVGMEPMLLNALRNGLGLKCVKRVFLHEPLTNLRKLVILVIERDTPSVEVWRAIYGLIAQNRAMGKFVIAINDDIDPENMDAVWWAMAYRCNPVLDMQVMQHRDQGHGPRSMRNGGIDASVCFDATLKEDFPPISLPKKEYMEKARGIWEELGLPPLNPQGPWFGYSLGDWTEDFEIMADRAVKGDYWVTGDIIAQQRRNDVPMNTEIGRHTGKKKDGGGH